MNLNSGSYTWKPTSFKSSGDVPRYLQSHVRLRGSSRMRTIRPDSHIELIAINVEGALPGSIHCTSWSINIDIFLPMRRLGEANLSTHALAVYFKPVEVDLAVARLVLDLVVPPSLVKVVQECTRAVSYLLVSLDVCGLPYGIAVSVHVYQIQYSTSWNGWPYRNSRPPINDQRDRRSLVKLFPRIVPCA